LPSPTITDSHGYHIISAGTALPDQPLNTVFRKSERAGRREVLWGHRARGHRHADTAPPSTMALTCQLCTPTYFLARGLLSLSSLFLFLARKSTYQPLASVRVML